ncbi:sensor histidine kinase [Phosphitispora fastidiosa]|uniref:sensor histidine kinase n=1 Tax=Phosphitispora fastidiosa TaxID=2837202 RepID=UPI001E6231FE|nr:HAMP domain-containing sensor histidine kinase [Phosphitispora fastidiosa]MBU7007586.1 signal transduction histidine kinase [Phosphitispora fastidiosa]
MSKQKWTYAKPPVVAEKIRSSLVLRLNLRMAGVLLRAFFIINILLSLLYFATVLWRAEIGAQELIDRYDGKLNLLAAEDLSKEHYLVKASAKAGEKAPSGLNIDKIFQDRLPLEATNALRSFKGPDISPQITLNRRLEEVGYIMTIPKGAVYYQITYPLAADIKFFLMLLVFSGGFEFLYLMSAMGRNRRVIRKILKPLSDLAETAKSLQEGLNSGGTGTNRENLMQLAGVISKLDTSEIDKGISIDQTQNELKDLARAINDMLNRINQSYQAQVRFVSDASHELRTPISVIQGYANLLDRWGKNDPKTMEESIQAIKGEAENMKALVEQLLFLARGDSENLPLQKAVIDICKLGEEIISEARLIDSGHMFRVDFQSPIFIKADQQLMKQAIRILVDNSIKYSPKGEEISLKIFSKDEKTYIQVQDKGVGIKPEDVPHIFDRFYRSADARGGKAGGAGLGLSIAKWIIEKHGGKFEVISRVDIGTRLIIELPHVTKTEKN